MILTVLSVLSRGATYHGDSIDVYYEVPKLYSNSKLSLTYSTNEAFYFIAFTSEETLNALRILVDVSNRGPGDQGGLIFVSRNVKIYYSSVKFFNDRSNPTLTVVRLNDYLWIYDSNISAANNVFAYNIALLTTITNSVSNTSISHQRGGLIPKLQDVKPCTECKANITTPAESCWNCRHDQIIDSLAGRQCKCIYSNAIMDDTGACVSQKVEDTVLLYEYNGNSMAYLLECVSNQQITINIPNRSSNYDSFSTLRNDACHPTNLYITGSVNIKDINYTDFWFGGLTYTLTTGATKILMDINVQASNLFYSGGLLYATAEYLDTAVTLDQIKLSGSLFCSGSSTQNKSHAGFIGVVSFCVDLTIKDSYTYGVIINATYARGVGLILGQAVESTVSMTNIYIAPYDSVFSNYVVDPTLGDWNEVTQSCKNSASVELKPSFYLQALSRQYDNSQKLSQYYAARNKCFAGLVGYLGYSNFTANNVIEHYDTNSNILYEVASNTGFISGQMNYSNVKINNLYASGNQSNYEYNGAIGQVLGGSIDMVCTLNFSSHCDGNSGAIGYVGLAAVVNMRVGINASFSGSVYYSGTIGSIEGYSIITILESIGKFDYDSMWMSYAGTVCGRITSSTLNGEQIDGYRTSIDDIKISQINSCV